MKQVKKMPLRSKLAIALTLFTAALAKPIKAEEKSKPKLSGSLTSTIATDYLSASGDVLGSGPVQQNYLDLRFGKHLSSSLWTNYDLTDNKLHERDLYLTTHAQKGKFSGKLGLQNWSYSKDLAPKDDFILDTAISHNGKINSSLRLTKRLTTGITKDQNRLVAKVSKPLEIYKNNDESFSVSIGPSVKTAWHDNYFSSDGFRHVTPTLSVSVNKGMWSLSASVSRQKALINNVENKTYSEVSLSYGF
jgi:hypothetical protein